MNKNIIWQSCLDYMAMKVDASQSNLQALKDSSANETKSSAGDKFETSREMMQQEITKAEIHLSNLIKQLNLLRSISPDQKSNEVRLGSFVVTNKGRFYISTSIGKMNMEDGIFYGISTESPMGSALIGLRTGASCQVNGGNVEIQAIY